MNQAVNQMDEVTQQNASLVEQASAASSAMSEQVNHMTQLIQFFKLIQTAPKETVLQHGQHASQRHRQRHNANYRHGQLPTAQPITTQKRQSNDKAIAALSNNENWDEF